MSLVSLKDISNEKRHKNDYIFRNPTGIVVACDVDNLNHMTRLVKSTCDIEGIVGYKVGCLLALRYSLKTISEIISRYTNLPVIYDHQKAATDIPQMGNNFAHVCKVAGVSGVILFPLAGPVTLKSFVKAAQEEELVPIVGGAMTHKGFFSVENGFISNEDALRIYDLASTLGVSHFVLPGTIPESFPEYIDTITQSCSSPIFLIPGIGTQGGQIEKAFSLLRGYNSYAIIGSAIYKTKDMRKSAQDFANQAISKIQKSFDQTEGEK